MRSVSVLGSSLWLVGEMGGMSLLFTLSLVMFSLVWFFWYARPRTKRVGAIYHTFARLGQNRFPGLDLELRDLAKEQSLRSNDSFDELVARAPFLDVSVPSRFDELLRVASRMLGNRVGVKADRIYEQLSSQNDSGLVPVSRGVALPHARLEGLAGPALLLVRCAGGLRTDAPPRAHALDREPVRAIFVLISPVESPGNHLRVLGHLATVAEEEGFLVRWMQARGEDQLKETLLRDEHTLVLEVGDGPGSASLAGRPLAEWNLPEGVIVAMIRRDRESLFPSGGTVAELGDRVTLIGEPSAIRGLSRRFEPGPGQVGPDGSVPVVAAVAKEIF